ncbi:putative hydroxypyruvate isomerase [Dysidea avara]|uniref:putative hydroxypyruvate isomerase n=1 Tax=Dysidea avara TaxID=196820 RepID=UPI0033200FD1
MDDLKFCANLSFLFKEVSLLDRYGAAARAGFAAVECGVDIYQYSLEQLVVARETAGVEQAHINAPTGDKPGDRGLAAVPGRHDDFKKSLMKSLEYAKSLHCTRIHFLAGIHPTEDWDRQQWEETYVNNLKMAAEECAKEGITALIEPLVTVPGYYLTNRKQAQDIINKVSHPSLKLQFDFYHEQISSGNLINFVTENISLIGHMQVSQVPVRNEPDSEGEINYPFVFQTLISLGYKKWIGCEYIPRGKTEDGLVWASRYLNKNN